MSQRTFEQIMKDQYVSIYERAGSTATLNLNIRGDLTEAERNTLKDTMLSKISGYGIDARFAGNEPIREHDRVTGERVMFDLPSRRSDAPEEDFVATGSALRGLYKDFDAEYGLAPAVPTARERPQMPRADHN